MPSLKSLFTTALLTATLATAAPTAYCSSENTGTSHSQGTNIYNSQGSCHDACTGYSYAILQYQKCFCSNSAPSSSVDINKCDQKCPGYPNDTCGNENEGLFTYVEIEGGGYGGTVTAAPTAAMPVTSGTMMPTMSSPAMNGTTASATPVANGSSSAAAGQGSGTSSGSAAAYTGAGSGLNVAVWDMLSIGAVLGCALRYAL